MNKPQYETKINNESYIDPSNVDEIIENIKKAEKHNEVVNIINNTFPNWILGWPKRYCTDYPHFQNNWKHVCKKTGSNTLSVIIVDFIIFNNPLLIVHYLSPDQYTDYTV